MQKIREVAGNFYLDLHTSSAYGGGDVSTAIGAATCAPFYAADGASVTQNIRHLSPSVYRNANSVDALRLPTV